MSEVILTSKPMRDAQTLTRPSFVVPPGACDSHVHVFESADRYPRVDKPHYTLPDGSLDKLKRMADVMKLQRFIIVQPSYYGTDNSCMLDALATVGARARGVAMVDDNCTDATLQRMHELDHGGYCELRSDLGASNKCDRLARAILYTRLGSS
jgi:2-pyrone-4,6-dicarboxylate lactonase